MIPSMDVNWPLVLIGAPGYMVTTVAALGLIGRGPVNLRRMDRERAHSIVAKEEREEQLDMLAPIADDLKRMADSYSDIKKAVMPNGGSSIADRVGKIEVSVNKLEDSMEELLRAKTYTMSESATFAGKIAQHDERIEKIERGRA